ncbi:hypothetical protein [Mesorhizobium sp. M0088]|uniref:hypothetical protein n=1 Tax=Mesorhizobium sp. M0088 TaxID=2956873 RepID=UPI003337F4CD
MFFTPQDYALYKGLLVEDCSAADVGGWTLMPNPLTLAPAVPDSLWRALAKVHRTYAGDHSRAAKENRAFPARSLRRRRDGGSSPGGGTLCRAESRTCRTGKAGGGLALVKRSGASDVGARRHY